MSVLVAHTGTDEGREAVRIAAAEAQLRGTALVIFDLDDSEVQVPEVTGEVRHARPESRDRDAVGALLDAVQSEGADLLVIGLRHRSAVGKFLLGSNAQQILLQATVPVLAVKPAAE